MVAPDPWMDIQGRELLPHTLERSSVSHYNQDFPLNLLPCWLGFVDGVDVPIHPNSLLGVGHFCGPSAVFLPVLWSSDSFLPFFLSLSAEVQTPQQDVQPLVVGLLHDVGRSLLVLAELDAVGDTMTLPP
jgi:hypothetical protein